ncbi:hypothetical protein BKA61DRAFT_566449 [Leptodontidium sp. MPI-SDFR-AT-0119]|nr:hypothetical protein BKA61DRAFT_566449 [Leptodontidium sp. MPI-SDFR-AT-0119]
MTIYASFGPSTRAELRVSLDVIEREFLGRGTTWINGDKISSSDVMVAWVVRWLLEGWRVGKEGFPKVYAWLGRLPSKEAEKVSDDQAVKEMLGGDYAVEESAELANDPLEIPIGQNVLFETTDSDPGSHHQRGKHVSVRFDTVTVDLKNKLGLHFPRRGVIVKRSSS